MSILSTISYKDSTTNKLYHELDSLIYPHCSRRLHRTHMAKFQKKTENILDR